jgi:hypothetical protein
MTTTMDWSDELADEAKTYVPASVNVNANRRSSEALAAASSEYNVRKAP